ncbi:MAG: hypothetical protein F6K17_38680 [Okeania sp. SIO3C4]|nr:hypothetical protein [Okeania sp. SIO3C4]
MIHRTTVARIIQRNQGVNFSNLEKIFNCLNLDLEEGDYEEVQNNQNIKTQIITSPRENHNVDRCQNYELQKYVQRPLIESQFYNSLLFTDFIVRIITPKKMGKTTFINRVLQRFSQEQDYRNVYISLLVADSIHFCELNNFLQWLCANVSSQLGLPAQLDDWNKSTKIFGSKVSCTNYFEKFLLQKLDSPIVLCLDNLELLFLYDNICQNFLRMLRSWNDKYNRNSLWKKLRLVLSYAPNIDINMNPNQSPFNLGTVIELPEFTFKEVQELAQIYQLNWDNFQVGELMKMVGGHPYLVELTIRSLRTRNDMTLENILETAPTETGIYHSPHLQEYLGILKQHSDLAKVFMSIIKGEEIKNIESHANKKLINLGLVKYENGKVLVRCELYRLYFENYLGDVA